MSEDKNPNKRPSVVHKINPNLDDESFSVWYSPDGDMMLNEVRFAPIEVAMEKFHFLTSNVAARTGLTARVIVVDMGDCIVAEWNNVNGLVWPKESRPKSAESDGGKNEAGDDRVVDKDQPRSVGTSVDSVGSLRPQHIAVGPSVCRKCGCEFIPSNRRQLVCWDCVEDAQVDVYSVNHGVVGKEPVMHVEYYTVTCHIGEAPDIISVDILIRAADANDAVETVCEYFLRKDVVIDSAKLHSIAKGEPMP